MSIRCDGRLLLSLKGSRAHSRLLPCFRFFGRKKKQFLTCLFFSKFCVFYWFLLSFLCFQAFEHGDSLYSELLNCDYTFTNFLSPFFFFWFQLRSSIKQQSNNNFYEYEKNNQQTKTQSLYPVGSMLTWKIIFSLTGTEGTVIFF